MRELTNIELDAVAGGDGVPGMPVWMNTITKYAISFPFNQNNTAQANTGWQGLGNFNFNPQLNAVNNTV